MIGNKAATIWRPVIKSAADQARKEAGPMIERFGPNIAMWTREQATEFVEKIIDTYLFEVDANFGGDPEVPF